MRTDYGDDVMVVFWKSISMAVTDAPLPAPVLAALKKTMQDDMHSLKYVAFPSGNIQGRGQELSDLLAIIDTARGYSLNFAEFSQACRLFCLSKNVPSHLPALGSSVKAVSPRHPSPQLPAPKPGLVLFRRDPRRKGSCRIVSVDGQSAKVRWLHNGKFTRIASVNLRNHRLFSLKRIFGEKTA